jgi:hypothetical protein
MLIKCLTLNERRLEHEFISRLIFTLKVDLVGLRYKFDLRSVGSLASKSPLTTVSSLSMFQLYNHRYERCMLKVPH